VQAGAGRSRAPRGPWEPPAEAARIPALGGDLTGSLAGRGGERRGAARRAPGLLRSAQSKALLQVLEHS
jgi:hypothetical protein